MKVVQINAVYEFSSTGRNTQELHEELLRRGHDSYVFCTNIKQSDKNIFKIGNSFDYKLHALCSRIFGRQAFFSRNSTKILIKSLKKIKPDLVLLGNLHANYIHLKELLTYLSSSDIPTVIVLHDCWFFTGHCCYYIEDNCNKWLTQCHHCPAINKYNKSYLFDRSSTNQLDKIRLFKSIKRLGVIGVSNWITGEAMRSPVLKDAKIIRRIYNWVDSDVFYPRKDSQIRSILGISKDDFVVLGVSHVWTAMKGLNQMYSIAERMPDIKFILVGGIDNQSKKIPNLYTVGRTQNSSELSEYYSIADVFLNCSIQETFGKVTAEALACGTPAIVNNATANPEIV